MPEIDASYLETTFRFVTKDDETLTLDGIMVYRADSEWVDIPLPPDEQAPPSYKGNIGMGWMSVLPADQGFNAATNCIVKVKIFPKIVRKIPSDNGASLRFFVKGGQTYKTRIDICIGADRDNLQSNIMVPDGGGVKVEVEKDMHKIEETSTFTCNIGHHD